MAIYKRIEVNNLLFISFFTIFFHLIPIGVETQPHFTLVFAIILMVFGKRMRSEFPIDVKILYFLIFILFSYTVFQLLSNFSFTIIVEFLKYLIGPIIFLALRKSNFFISFKVYRWLIYFLTALAILNITLPSIYEFIFENFIPRFSGNVPGGFRGITILTPEPSYFAIFQIILLIILEKHLAYKGLGIGERRSANLLKYLVIGLCLLTKSAYVLMICVIFILPPELNFRKFAKILAIASVIIFLIVNVFVENRLTQIIVLITGLINENDFNLISFLFTQESSGGTRIILNFLAITSMLTNPFGSGLGSFSSRMLEYSSFYNLDLSNHEVLGNDLIGKIYPQTYFANLCNDIGVFSFLLFPIIFLNNDNNDKGFNLKRNLCLLVMILFQSQITNPAFWFLIAISKIPHDQKIFK